MVVVEVDVGQVVFLLQNRELLNVPKDCFRPLNRIFPVLRLSKDHQVDEVDQEHQH